MTADGAPHPSGSAQAPELVGEFGWALSVLVREWRARVESVVGDLPHGPRGYQVLATVVREEPPNQASLATRLGIDRSVMTYLIDRYVESGLMERQPDATDRRVRRIVPTQHGRQTLDKLDARVREVERELLSCVAEPDRPVLCRLLRQAAAALSQHPVQAPLAASGMGAGHGD